VPRDIPPKTEEPEGKALAKCVEEQALLRRERVCDKITSRLAALVGELHAPRIVQHDR
jgi:hypothetical protein